MNRTFIGPAVAALVFAGLSLVSLAGAALGDTVYAVSNTDGRIIRYDSSDPAGTVVTLSGSGAIVSAAGLALGPDGNLYIGEAGDFSTVSPSIRRLNLASNTLSTVHTFSDFGIFPAALAFRGNDLFVGRNPFFGDVGPIVKLAGATGSSPQVANYTTGGSLASSPGIAFGPDGSLYVSNQTYSFLTQTASGPVAKFDASGAFVGDVVASGSTTGLYGPTGIGLRGSTLYTSSIMAGTVLQTSLASLSTSSFGSTGVPFGASPLALLSDGGLIVGSAGGAGAIYRFDAGGGLQGTFNSGLGTIGGLFTMPVPEPAGAVSMAIGAVVAAAWFGRRRAVS